MAQSTIHESKYMCSIHDIAADKILRAQTPNQAHIEGNKIKGKQDSTWMTDNRLVMECMFKVCKMKFEQNDELRRLLLNTANNSLVEGIQTDRIWGAGISYKIPAIFNSAKWTGKNYMDEVLTRVREELKNKCTSAL